MCFSASSSFIASLFLAVTFVGTYRRAQKETQIPFALIPGFFSIQQFSEWLIWLIYGGYINSSFLIKPLSYVFLFFALVVWPTWVPISVFSLEKKYNRKYLLSVMVALGLIFSIVMFISFFKYSIAVNIDCNHIYYQLKSPNISEPIFLFITGLYLFLTIFPFFCSSSKFLNVFGVLIALSALLTILYWFKYLISVWCFFAALLSSLIYIIIRWQNFRRCFEESLFSYEK